MKKIKILVTLLLIAFTEIVFSQKAEEKLFNQFREQNQNKEFTKALETLEKFIKKFPDSKNIPEVYYNKGIVHTKLNDDENAIQDFTMAYKKDSLFVDAIRLRGNIKNKLNKESEALEDYNLAIKIDPTFAEAYYDKAFILKNQSKQKEACENFEFALRSGIQDAAIELKQLCDTNSIVLQKYHLYILNEKSTDNEYGYSPNKPIKIGSPVSRQRTYFSFLKDSKGNSVKYTRSGSCCPYPSRNGLFFGIGMCDKYEVESEGKIRTLYISMYDYEEPKIPVDFYTAEDFKK